MARYITRLRTDRPPTEVFDFMADLRNFARWDPGVRVVEQIEGVGAGVSAVFDVTVAGLGPAPDQTLRYRTTEFEAPFTALVVAKNHLLTSEDRITVEPDGEGSILTYDADLRLGGGLRAADPLLKIVFDRIGDRAAAGLREALDGVRVP